MKLRAKAIDEVMRFTELSCAGRTDGTRNVNDSEVQFILGELRKLKEARFKATVGIITPHTDQQKRLVDAVGRVPERQYLYDELKLKIMTFDTCQGEERDIIFYSMVANPSVDRLWGVFIKDLSSVDLEEEGKLKAQRLNVGFSRAKECMHFVISKPLCEYQGAIGEALRHFSNVREEAKKERPTTEVDQRSVREAQVLNWFYQTTLWKEERERLEFIPQFELGKYLKQLDPHYSHPMYRVDFLLVYRPQGAAARTIIIEYDGFREHFGEGIGVTASNFESYYSEEDLYRQKLLESYGYRFLRINRFNVGDNPILTLDARLHHLLKFAGGPPHNHLIECIQDDVEQQRNGELKECPKCKELRKPEDFRDSSLRSGTGRFCAYCKGKRTIRVAAPAVKPVVGPSPCPNCGSRMLLRKGRYRGFYGCSKFPYCKATRPLDVSAQTAHAGDGSK
jgi:ssDNA-binding Zn-finger/Zn-ribbon topoisomerase 1